jgi:SagB-type dehydrogenase family enzyme
MSRANAIFRFVPGRTLRLSLLPVLALSLSSCLYPLCAGGDERSAAQDQPIRGVDNLSVGQRRAFLRGTLSDWRADTDMQRGRKPPPIQKPYPADAKQLELPPAADLKLGDRSVRETIEGRRSRRDFSDAAFSIAELSYLLRATQGISKIERDADGKVAAQFRTVPSGGGRHPFETYLAVSRVEGVNPGFYRYLPLEHRLLLIREDSAASAQVAAVCYAQDFIAKAAVTFVWTAIPRRTEWKYGSIAQKLIAIEAGHLCQNLYLAAESIHAGVCASLGYNQAKLDNLLGVDGEEEFVIYLAAAGKPNETEKP